MSPQRFALAGAAYGALATAVTLLVVALSDGDPAWLLTVALLPLWPAALLGAAARSPRSVLLGGVAAGTGLAQLAVVVGAFSGNLLGAAVTTLPVMALALLALSSAVLSTGSPAPDAALRPTSDERR